MFNVAAGKLVCDDGRIFISYVSSVNRFEVNVWKGQEYIRCISVTPDELKLNSDPTSNLYSYLMSNDYVNFLEVDDLLSYCEKSYRGFSYGLCN